MNVPLTTIFFRQIGNLRNGLGCACFHHQPQHRQLPLRAAKASYPAPNTWEEEFEWSMNDPESFWAKQANRRDWHRKWQVVLDQTANPFTKWFVGGTINICYNALDRHVVRGHEEHLALIWDSPISGQKKKFTYKQLLEQVQMFANVLRSNGVRQGDRVLIYMPMIPEAIIAMLATARLGAIHTVVFGGFAPKELAVRIAHTAPRVIVSASAGLEPNRVIDYKPLLDKAIELSDAKPEKVVMYQRPNIGKVTFVNGRDLDWETEMNRVPDRAEAVPVEANQPLYILHTSGTTGSPKGIVRPHGGYAVALPWTMHRIFGANAGERWWAASDLGWVVGHSYICYAPLLAGLTTVVYEGKPVGTPDAGQFFRVIAEHDVSQLLTAPTALRAIRQYDAYCVEGKKYNIRNLRMIHTAGEHLDHETRLWSQSEDAFNVPIMDHWWQTESGWPMTAACVGYRDADLNPPKDSSGLPCPGWDVRVLKENGAEAKTDEMGQIFVKLPLPPGSCSTFWQNDAGFKKAYFDKIPGYYDTMDAGMRFRDGDISVMSRLDDVINVAGHRISGGALEEAILDHIYVVDCAVVGVPDQLKGEVPLALCVVRADFNGSLAQVADEVVKMVREHVGAVAVLKKVIFVDKLPKTRSGKIPRNTLMAMATGKPFKIPVTIEDASVYPAVLQAMQDAGIGMETKLPELS